MSLGRSLRSFRLRLALFSAGCTAAILVLLGTALYFCLLQTASGEVIRQLDRPVRNLLFIAFPGALLLSFGAATLVVQRALRPIRTITETVTRITAEGLDERIDIHSNDLEFAQLQEVFNSMLDRLQRSFENAHRFTGNAAHELKTPLTILQGKIEEAIRTETPGSSRQQFLTELLDEVARLKSITERLLLLSRADAGRLDLHIDTTNLSELLTEVAEDAALLAPKLQIKTLIPGNITVRCDRPLIAQVIHNLVTNAIKYNIGDGGVVGLELGHKDGYIIVRVTNTGRLIPAHMHERIFERFNRGDRSQSKRIEGVGLGLSLSREIARAHAGDLILTESSERRTRFVLQLPGGRRSPVEGRPGASSAFASTSSIV